MKNLHWDINATDKLIKQKDGDYRIHFGVNIQVKHLETEEEAIARAKEIVKRKHYYLRGVLECECAKHNMQHLRQLEATKEYTKVLKKQLRSDEDE